MIDSFRGYYNFLSNFSKHGFVDESGNYWKTNEHYFQAMKCANGEDSIRIMQADTPSSAKKLGRECKMVGNWNQIKNLIMLDGLLMKFRQNKDIKEKLLATGDEILVEGNNWGDKYWGVCDGEGKNKLGELLMKVRQILKNEDMLNNIKSGGE